MRVYWLACFINDCHKKPAFSSPPFLKGGWGGFSAKHQNSVKWTRKANPPNPLQKGGAHAGVMANYW